MRASVSPGKITHTHSEGELTPGIRRRSSTSDWREMIYLGPLLLLTGRNWPRHVWHLSKTFCTHTHTRTHTSLYMYVWTERKKPSATYWLGLELREFWPLSHDNLPDLQPGLAERQRSPSQTATQKQYVHGSQVAALQRAISITGGGK